MRPRLIRYFFFALSAISAGFAQNESLFSDLNAYNPVPSPDGKLVAFVQTGWGGKGGSGGFGRSNLVSEAKITDANGKIVNRAETECFVGEWLPDASAVVCYRDSRFGLVTTQGWIQQGTMRDKVPTSSRFVPAERVAFLPLLHRFAWIDRHSGDTILQTPEGAIGDYPGDLPTSDLIVPSPDGRYVAVAGTIAGNGFHLLTFDLKSRRWTDMGEVNVHPDQNWDYIKPSWNPWFSDSTHLTYISNNALYVATPDGGQKNKIADVVNAGLPVPSPDGKRIAYATFTPRPMKLRPDLRFWGDVALWAIPTTGGKPTRFTEPTSDTTYDLRWLNNTVLLFDRISDTPFYSQARIWKVNLGPAE